MTAEIAVKVQWDCEHSGNLQFLQSKNLQCSGYQNKWNIHRIGKSAVADWIPMTQK